MTARRSDLSSLPDWPRLLSRDQAAMYVGLSPRSFDLEVAAGTFPGPVELKRVRRLLWERKAIDARIDQLSDLSDDGGYEARKAAWQNRFGRE